MLIEINVKMVKHKSFNNTNIFNSLHFLYNYIYTCIYIYYTILIFNEIKQNLSLAFLLI